MTPVQRQDMAGMGPERLNTERNRWELLKASVETVRNHPLLPELERVGAQAGALWQRNAMLMNMPGSGEQITENWQRMGELYDRAMELRARMLGTRIQSAFGIQPGSGDPRDKVLERLNTSFSIDGNETNGPMRTVNRTLQTYARGLTADPNAVLDGSSRDGYFYARNRAGRMTVNWRRVQQARENIDMIANSPASAINPGQRELLQQMRSGIQQVESVDPVGAAIASWQRNYPRGHSDTRPLRFIAGVGASLVTGVGLIMAAKPGGGFTWPTALWAGIAALSINPDLARSNTFNAVRRLQYLNEPDTINMMQRGNLTGERGAAVLEELQELRRNKSAEFRMLGGGRRPVTMAQIGELTEGRDTPLTQAMARLSSDQERAAFLRQFAAPRSRDEQQILREYVRTRDRVDPRLEQSRFLFGDNTAV